MARGVPAAWGAILLLLGLLAPAVTRAAETNIPIESARTWRGLRPEDQTDVGGTHLPWDLRPEPGARVLVYASDKAARLVEILRSYPDVARVDFLNAQFHVPSLEYLLQYDAVITWPNWEYKNAVDAGNALAAFVTLEPNNVVVCTVFCWFLQGNSLLGAIMFLNYNPFYPDGGGTHYATACLGNWSAGNCITSPFSGQTVLCEYYRDVLGLNSYIPEVEWGADYEDGERLIAVKDDRVVGINAYPGDYTSPEAEGDVIDIVHSAIRCYVLEQLP
jgi:hypothetical protein